MIQLHKRGILLGMGTDAYTNDMLESLKVAPCAPSAARTVCPTWAGARSRICLFRNNAKIGEKYFPVQLGVLEGRRRRGHHRHGL